MLYFNILLAFLLLGSYGSKPSSSDSDSTSNSNDMSVCNPKNMYHRRGRYYRSRGGQEITYLRQSDFDMGSIRITKSGYYAIIEDIVFNPLPNLDNPNDPCAWFPCNDDNFPGSFDTDTFGPFQLGFWAAVVIEADDVEINICDHKMEQGFDFYVQQRFFAHFEVSNQVLLSGQGPFDAGLNLISVKNVVIKNGELGLSSHWGIHGLDPENLRLENLKVNNFEVAGIHINGFNNLVMKNIEIGAMSTIVPSRYPYAQVRDIIKILDRVRQRVPDEEIKFSDRDEVFSVTDIFEELQYQANLFFFYITNRLDRINSNDFNSLQKALSFLINKLGFPDCASNYGIVLNSRGFATQNFGNGIGFSNDAYLEDIIIHDLFLNMEEVVGYVQTDDNTVLPARGPFGDLFSLTDSVNNFEFKRNKDLTGKLDKLEYNGNILQDAQLTVAKFGELASELQGTSITQETIDWAMGSGDLVGNLMCNQDTMNHLGKGLIGLRIDDSNNVNINNLKVKFLNNWSNFGSLACGNYNSSSNGGHNRQPPGQGFGGSTVRGISIHGSDDIKLKNIYIQNINSRNGNSYGIDILGNNTKISFENNINIFGINAGEHVNLHDLELLKSGTTPNPVPEGCDVHFVDKSDPNLSIEGFRNVRSYDINGAIVCNYY